MSAAPDADAGGPPSRALKDAALDGVRWTAFARVAAEIVGVGSAVVLARLVSPAQFGLLAAAVFVRELALMTSNEGIGSPLVQRRDLRGAHLEAGALLALAGGLVLTLLTLLVAPLATTPLLGAGATQLVRLFSPAFLLAAAMIVPLAQLQRGLRFRRIGAVEVAGGIATAIVSVALALAGLEAKAYVLGMLAGLAVQAIGLLASAPLARPRWRPRELREIASFGLPAAAAGLAGVAYRNVDYLIVAGRLGPLLSGYYYRAFTLGVSYEDKVSGVLSRVTFPVYSRTDGIEHLRRVRMRIVRVNATVVWPVLACFIAIAPVAVPWVFGARWEPAVVPAQLLAVAGMASTIRRGTGPLVLAAGHPRALLAFSVAETLGYAAAVAVACSYGLTAVAGVVSCFQIGALCLAYVVLLKPMVGVSLRQLAADVGAAAVSCAVLLVVALPLAALLEHRVAALPFVAVVVTVAALTYALTLRSLFGAAWADVVLLVRTVARRPSPGGAGLGSRRLELFRGRRASA